MTYLIKVLIKVRLMLNVYLGGLIMKLSLNRHIQTIVISIQFFESAIKKEILKKSIFVCKHTLMQIFY